jgi:plastocyanin
MRASSLFSFAGVLVAGVLGGIGLDWSTHKHQHITYVVEDYQMANLEVHPGDKIKLMKPDGSSTGQVMNFVGNSPCVVKKPHSDTCEIDPSATQGAYFFTCSSKPDADEDGCPDPGIQPSSTPGGFQFGYWRTVGADLHMIDLQPTLVEAGKPTKMQGTAATSAPFRAYVFCDDKGNTALQDQHHQDLTTITAPKNQSVFWLSSDPFTLAPNDSQTWICADPKPASGMVEAECTVNVSSGATQYTVTAPSCNPLKTATLTSK